MEFTKSIFPEILEDPGPEISTGDVKKSSKTECFSVYSCISDNPICREFYTGT